MRDYEGPMSYFEEQLFAEGITREDFDIRNWVGCTKRELQGLVDMQIQKKRRETKEHGSL